MTRLSELRDLVRRAKQAYYFGGVPIMTDPAYDVIEAELAKLSPLGWDDPALAVGAPIPPDSMLKPVKHKRPMGSLGKCNTEQEARDWYKKYGAITKYGRGHKIHASLKGDGSSAAAYYTNGVMDLAASRGGGTVGEDITASAMRYKGLPAYIEVDGKPFNGSIRFETILTKADWKIVGGKNPRNQGSGMMGREDGFQAEYLTAFAIDLVDEDRKFKTETEKFSQLKEMGATVILNQTFDSIDEVVKWFGEMMEARGGINNTGSIPYWIDGIVLRIDDIEAQEAFGESSGKPRAQIAWKPEVEGFETVLRSYEITMGHTGQLVPNARFDPVEIGGSTVSQALMNNFDEIKKLDIAIGDTIVVIKAGEIIPKIIRVAERPKNRVPIEDPTVCPVCGGKAGRETLTDGRKGARTICLNEECPSKTVDCRLKNWIKKTDVLGIGDAVRDAIVEQLGVTTIDGLYGMKAADLATIEFEAGSVLGEKNAQKIVDELKTKSHMGLELLFGSLGIKHLGRRRVQLIREACPGEFDTLGDWTNPTKLQKFAAKAHIPSIAKEIISGIQENKTLIKTLLDKGYITLVKEEKRKMDKGNLTGKVVCFTGVRPKADETEKFTSMGGVVKSGVSKNLTHLVAKDPKSTSGKARDALDLGVDVISYEEFQAWLQN